MNQLLKLAGFLVAFFAAAQSVSAADYYVSVSGNDANSGTSAASAWRTTAQVNRKAFAPGDQILFEGSQSFSGNLYFDPNDAGTSDAPVVVSSYGTGRATISSSSATGLYAYNTSGFIIKNVNFTGGSLSARKSGISFYADLPGGVKLSKIEIDNVEVKGYGESGITIGSWNGDTGYRNVRITNADLHDNVKSGLTVYAYKPNVHENIYVGYVRAYNNTGVAGTTRPSGSGIVLGHVNHATIERSVAYNNGAKNTSNGGPVGIWTYSSNDVLIQNNESHHNHTNSQTDGGGFDLDGGTTNSVLQYNYSHDNDGPGFMICQFAGAGPMSGNIIRNNISQNDGRKNNYAGIALWSEPGPITDSSIYNNTVYMSPSGTTQPKAVRAVGANFANIEFRSNILITTGGVRSVYAPSTYGLKFEDNAYWADGGRYSFDWGGVNYSSLAAWRVTQQETMDGTPLGYDLDPQLVNAGGGQTIGDADRLGSLSAYLLKASSPLIDRGRQGASLFDFYGSLLPQGAAYDIGAAEFSSDAPPPPPPPPPIGVGSRVKTVTTAAIYSRTSTTSKVRGTQPAEIQGTIVSGPEAKNGYTWWTVNFDEGTDGWVVSPTIQGAG